jgi:hypothetical protein
VYPKTSPDTEEEKNLVSAGNWNPVCNPSLYRLSYPWMDFRLHGVKLDGLSVSGYSDFNWCAKGLLKPRISTPLSVKSLFSCMILPLVIYIIRIH